MAQYTSPTMSYYRTYKVCFSISTLLLLHSNHHIDAIDIDENMYALASTAHEHHQIGPECRSQIELLLGTENFAFVDLTGDDDMDYAAPSHGECQDRLDLMNLSNL